MVVASEEAEEEAGKASFSVVCVQNLIYEKCKTENLSYLKWKEDSSQVIF